MTNEGECVCFGFVESYMWEIGAKVLSNIHHTYLRYNGAV